MSDVKELADLLGKVLEYFGLGEVQTYQKSEKGMSNRTFLVSDSNDGQYAVRIFKHFDRAVFKNELYIEKRLRANGLKTNHLLKALNGSYTYEENNIQAVVSYRIKGNHLDYPIAKGMCYQFGRILALFHTSFQSLPSKNPNVLLTDLENSDVSLAEIEEDALRETLKEILSITNEILKEDLPLGIMHGDFHADNLIVSGSDIFILDFERSAKGRLILDVARSIADICRVDNTLDEGRMSEFISGYESIRRLTKTEKRILNKAISFSSALIATRIMKHGHSGLGLTFVDISKKALEIDGIIV